MFAGISPGGVPGEIPAYAARVSRAEPAAERWKTPQKQISSLVASLYVGAELGRKSVRGSSRAPCSLCSSETVGFRKFRAWSQSVRGAEAWSQICSCELSLCSSETVGLTQISSLVANLFVAPSLVANLFVEARVLVV